MSVSVREREGKCAWGGRERWSEGRKEKREGVSWEGKRRERGTVILGKECEWGGGECGRGV